MKRFFVMDDRFFIIDFNEGDYEFSLNYGTMENSGEYKIYDFDSKEECKGEVSKLIQEKLHEGYIETKNFNLDNHIFIDDFDYGAHEKTSHPNFINHFTDELYFRIYDEETPFGSDEGHDCLAFLTDEIIENPDLVFYDFPKKLVEDTWDLKYIPVESLDKADIKKLIKSDKINMIQSDMVTYATAFAQIKLTGCIDKDLKVNAINSMKRYNTFMELSDYPRSKTIDKMIEDLSEFNSYL